MWKNRMRRTEERLRIARTLVLMLAGIYTALGCCGTTAQESRRPAASRTTTGVEIEYPVKLIGPLADWRAQDFNDSQGVTGVHYDRETRSLLVDFDLQGQHKNRSKGELVLDLRYVPTLERAVPVDMSGRRIIVDIEIPWSFISRSANLNGCQVFVKDDKSRSQFCSWHNCDMPGLARIHLQPSGTTPWHGYTDPGFDPRRIRTIGIKFATNSMAQAGARFRGQIRVKNISVTPDLPWTPPIALPAESPRARLRSDSRWQCREDGFYVDGKKTFVVGGNWRGVGYGQNWGSTLWFPSGNGLSRHSGFVAARLDTFRRAGVNVIRVGLLDDGRSVLDKSGRVVGLNEVFRSDVRTLLDLADKFDIKVEFVLMDFLLAGRGRQVDGVWIRGRGQVIEDRHVRGKFLSEFLDPFLEEFGNHRAVFGFDIINEPEWIIGEEDGGGWETVKEDTVEQRLCKAVKPVSGQAFRQFVAACVKRIRHKTPDKLVTVGVSCKYLGLVEGFDLDYYAPHFYRWMGDLNENLANIPGGKPWILEEYPGKDDLRTYMRAAWESGGGGAMVWNLSPGIDEHVPGFDEEESKLQEIREIAGKLP